MRCVDCGSEKWREERRDIPFDGVPYVRLRNIEHRVCEECGADEQVIPAFEQLVQLVRTIVCKRPKLTGADARFLRASLGWSESDVAKHLHISEDAVRAWEQGQTKIPTPKADELKRASMDPSLRIDAYPTPPSSLERNVDLNFTTTWHQAAA